MRTSAAGLVVAAAMLTAGCGGGRANDDSRESVRGFMATVARDVTAEGPSAWRKHFADDPAFFMAANGQLQFSDNKSAGLAIDNLARTIKHIELQWGDDLRVDPVAANVAVVGCSYHEVMVSNDGGSIDANGFFTGTAEYRAGRWQFRNAHWSVPAPVGQASSPVLDRPGGRSH